MRFCSFPPIFAQKMMSLSASAVLARLLAEKSSRPLRDDCCFFLEPMSGLEPLTYALRVRCSTN